MIAQQHTDPMSRNVHFKSANAADAPNPVSMTDKEAKNSSAGSSDSSASLKDTETAVSTPVRGQTRASSHSGGQYQVSTHVLSDDESQQPPTRY